jgi:hypothetical protein
LTLRQAADPALSSKQRGVVVRALAACVAALYLRKMTDLREYFDRLVAPDQTDRPHRDGAAWWGQLDLTRPDWPLVGLSSENLVRPSHDQFRY